MPTAERIAGFGLAIAAATIMLLAAVVLADIERETALNREVIGALQVKDALEGLRLRLGELKLAAREQALTGSAPSARDLERLAVEIEADLAYLAPRAAFEPGFRESAGSLGERVKAFVVHARSLARGRGAMGAGPGAAGEDPAEVEARAELERSLETLTGRINEATLAQIRLGDGLRTYVVWILGGSIALLVGLFALFRHVQARAREAQRRIERLAHFDPVTGLPNRTLLADRLAMEAARSHRDAQSFAVVLFDLDGFKGVNDTQGHAAGDALLAQVAERAKACVRASDTVGRLGGDEFLAILPETSRDGAERVAEKIRAALGEPFAIAGRTAAISASVGVSLFPEHGDEHDALLRVADAALYEAKREGKNRTRVAPAPEKGAADPGP